MKKILLFTVLLLLLGYNSYDTGTAQNNSDSSNNLFSSTEKVIGVAYSKPLPKLYTDKEIKQILKKKLSDEELSLIEYPYEANEEIKEYTKKITEGLKTDLEKAKAIFHAIIDEDKLGLTIIETADFKKTYVSPRTTIKLYMQRIVRNSRSALCSEMTILFLTMAKISDLESYIVRVYKDFRSVYVNHACVALRYNGKIVLIDPSIKGFDIRHKNFEVYNNLGATALYNTERATLIYKTDTNTAEALCKIAIKICPQYADAYELLGLIYAEKGLIDKAITNLRKVLDVNKNYIEPLYYLSLIYENIEEYEKAKDNLKKYRHALAQSNILSRKILDNLQQKIIFLEQKQEQKFRVAQKNIANLSDENANIRAKSAFDLGELKSKLSIPFLIEALKDEDEDVRYFAAESLRKITNQNFNFKSYAPQEEREKAIKNWRVWWNKNKDTFKEE